MLLTAMFCWTFASAVLNESSCSPPNLRAASRLPTGLPAMPSSGLPLPPAALVAMSAAAGAQPGVNVAPMNLARSTSPSQSLSAGVDSFLPV